MKVVGYELCCHNLTVGHSVKEALEQVKSVLKDLRKLAKWEKQGKIRCECFSSSPSVHSIVVLDKSIEPELQKIGIVFRFEYEMED